MKIAHYTLPYHQTLQLKQGHFQQREGLILSQSGPTGTRYGEVAPFPGLSPEKLSSCLQALQQTVHSYPIPASVSWGLHMLQHPLPMPHPSACLPVNALLTGLEPKALMQTAQARYAEGYRSFKLKVGQQSLEQDLQSLHNLLRHLPEIQLRLDANRSWSLADLHTLLSQLPEQGIDYLEEPLKNPADYAYWPPSATCRLALDESLAEPAWQTWAGFAQVLVLKPMLLGPERLQACLALARETQKQVVFSSVFESGLGLRYLAQLAWQQAPQTPAGLDTWRMFAEDLWEPAFQTEAGQIKFCANVFTDPPQLRLKWVRQVTV